MTGQEILNILNDSETPLKYVTAQDIELIQKLLLMTYISTTTKNEASGCMIAGLVSVGRVILTLDHAPITYKNLDKEAIRQGYTCAVRKQRAAPLLLTVLGIIQPNWFVVRVLPKKMELGADIFDLASWHYGTPEQISKFKDKLADDPDMAFLRDHRRVDIIPLS